MTVADAQLERPDPFVTAALAAWRTWPAAVGAALLTGLASDTAGSDPALRTTLLILGSAAVTGIAGARVASALRSHGRLQRNRIPLCWAVLSAQAVVGGWLLASTDENLLALWGWAVLMAGPEIAFTTLDGGRFVALLARVGTGGLALLPAYGIGCVVGWFTVLLVGRLLGSAPESDLLFTVVAAPAVLTGHLIVATAAMLPRGRRLNPVA